MENKRLIEISYLRAIAIVLVVLFHSFCPYMGWKFVRNDLYDTYISIFVIWLGARMPLFLFISGFLFSYLIHIKGKYEHIGLFAWNKVKRLLIPYFIFTFLMMLSHERIVNFDTIEWKGISWDFFRKGYWHLWFLLALFYCFVITRSLAKVKLALVHVVVIIALSFLCIYHKSVLSYFTVHYNFPARTSFALNFFIHYYVYFYWGYLISRYREKLSFLFNWKAIISFFIVWLSISVFRTNYIIDTNDLLYNVAKYFANISFVCLVYISFSLLNQKGYLKDNFIVNRLNMYSYGIYIFHVWLISFLFYNKKLFAEWILIQAKGFPIIFPTLLFIAIMFFSILFSYLLLKTRIGRFLIG